MTSVSEKNKWKALAFSTLIRFFPHLSRALWALVIGSFMDSSIRHVQESRQESLAIFPHACLGRYVWLESHVSLDQLGKLIL